jgi:type I restriction enzyme S subunit
MKQTIALGDLCDIALGATPPRGSPRYWDVSKTTENVWLSIADMPLTNSAVVSESKEYLSDEGAARGKLVKEGTLLVATCERMRQLLLYRSRTRGRSLDRIFIGF